MPQSARGPTPEDWEAVRAQLLKACTTAALGIAAGGVAHDINNVLSVIRGHAEIVIADMAEADPLRDVLERIRLAADVGAALTEQLVLLSRRQQGPRTLLSLNTIAHEVLDALVPVTAPNIAVHTHMQPGLWPVWADRVGMGRIVMNLVANAKDAMPEGGTLTITTENATIDEESCGSIPGARPGDWVCLTVADTGVGMDEQTRGRIFEPFFTTKEAAGGAGLGLSVVQGIVTRHHGWIRVYGAPGRGAAFKVYLPACSAGEQAGEAIIA